MELVAAADGGAWMESLATSIGCGRRRVEGRGVLVAIDGAYMARREVQIARGTGRRARSSFCQAVRGLAIMPSCPKYKLQIQKRWITHFVIFDKLQECKSQI